MKKLIVSVVALALLSGCQKAGADKNGDGVTSPEEMALESKKIQLQPGEWEISVEVLDVAMGGLPEGAPDMTEAMKKSGKQTNKACLTKEQSENPGAQFFAPQNQKNCDVRDFNMGGGAIKADMTCPVPQGGGQMAMKMNGTYSKTAYDMTMDVNAEGMANNITMKMQSKISGKRVGDCPA